MSRIKSLDIMRGFAALAVILCHGITLFSPQIVYELRFSPFYALVAAKEAVMFFFVLSGFVLSLIFLGKSVKYSNYIIKRVLRIYIPYLIAIIFTFICVFLFAQNSHITGLSDWGNSKWRNYPTYYEIFQHILFIGDYNSSEYNPAIWTLIHEMRISLIFPLIILMVAKISWIKLMFIGLSFTFISGLNKLFGWQESLGHNTSIFDTLHYISAFMLGALIAKNKDLLISLYQSFNRLRKMIFIMVGITFFLYSQLLIDFFNLLGLGNPFGVLSSVNDWAIFLGASILIIVVISERKLSILENSKILLMNGKLSFSTYLYHMPILLTCFNTFSGLLNNWVILGISIILTYLVAYLSWKYVEKTSIKIGVLYTQKRLIKNKIRDENFQRAN